MLWKSSDGSHIPSKDKKVQNMNARRTEQPMQQGRQPAAQHPNGDRLSKDVDMIVNWKPKKSKLPGAAIESGSMTIRNPQVIPVKGDWVRVNGNHQGKVVKRLVSPHKFKPWVVTIKLGRIVEIK